MQNLLSRIARRPAEILSLTTWLDNPFEGLPALAEIDMKQLSLGLTR